MIKLFFRLHILFMLIFLVPSNVLTAQECPFGIENCRGGCGRWIDADGDGICDRSSNLFQVKDTISEIKNLPDPDNQFSSKTFQSHQNESNEADSELLLRKKNLIRKLLINSQRIHEGQAFKAYNPHRGPRYQLIFYSSLTTGGYLLSLLLLYTGVFSKKIHRRIWNLLLLATFIMSGLLGLFLVVQINYKVLPSYYLQFLQWHVDFGIGMALISVFHIIWHFKYFKNMFKRSVSEQQKP